MTHPPASLTPLSQGYASLLTDIKQRVRQAQVRAMLSVNAELIRLYWGIGQMIHERQQQEGWGAGVIPRLARDLHNELPEERAFPSATSSKCWRFIGSTRNCHLCSSLLHK